MSVTFTIPLKTVSESNFHGSWRARAGRTKKTRHLVGLVTSSGLKTQRKLLESLGEGKKLRVLLVRISPRSLDDDNLRGCLKATRDSVSDALGLPNDRDPRVLWEYGQEKGKPKEYAVRITISPAAETTEEAPAPAAAVPSTSPKLKSKPEPYTPKYNRASLGPW